MTALQNLCGYVWGAFSYPSVQEDCPFPTAAKLPSLTGALVASLGWVPRTQWFKTGWKLWPEVPCRKPSSFPVKQNELFINFLVLVTFKFSNGFICRWLPSASSPVVSSTVDEASLGFSHGSLAAMMSVDNFLALPSAGKTWIIWVTYLKVNLRTMMCCAESVVVWACKIISGFVFEWCPCVLDSSELWKHVHAAVDILAFSYFFFFFHIFYFFTNLGEVSLFRKPCQVPSWLLSLLSEAQRWFGQLHPHSLWQLGLLPFTLLLTQVI